VATPSDFVSHNALDANASRGGLKLDAILVAFFKSGERIAKYRQKSTTLRSQVLPKEAQDPRSQEESSASEKMTSGIRGQ